MIVPIHFPYHVTLASPTVRLYSYYDLPNFLFFILMYPSQFGTCYSTFKLDVNTTQWGQKLHEIVLSKLRFLDQFTKEWLS